MPEVRDDLQSWKGVFEALAWDFMADESGYILSNKTNPDVIVPAENVKDPNQMSFFQSADHKSFDLGASYVKRDTRETCSIQIRAYDDGEHLHQNLGHEFGLGGKGAPDSVVDKYPDTKLYYVQLNWYNPMEGDSVVDRAHNMMAHLLLDVLKVNIPDLAKRECDMEFPD